MQIPRDIAIRLQSRVRDLAFDMSTCALFIQYPSGSSQPSPMSEWQTAVDSIYRCLKSGLISVWRFGLGCSDEVSFLGAVRAHDPFDRDDDGLIWNGIFLSGTDKLTDLITRHFPDRDAYAGGVNGAFAAELAAIFKEAGVPWSDKPLLPIIVAPNKA